MLIILWLQMFEKIFFSNRVFDKWNSLWPIPVSLLHCNTVDTFKKKN